MSTVQGMAMISRSRRDVNRMVQGVGITDKGGKLFSGVKFVSPHEHLLIGVGMIINIVSRVGHGGHDYQ